MRYLIMDLLLCCGRVAVNPAGLRCLVAVESQSRPLMRFICGLIGPQKKTDKLVLAQVGQVLYSGSFLFV